MNIALVVDDFHGGAGNVAQLLALELKKVHTVSMVMTNLHSAPRYDLTGVSVLDESISIRTRNKVKGILDAIKKMKCAIEEKAKADLVISFLDNNNSIACFSQWKTKIPIIVSERSNPLVILPAFPWDILRRIAYKRANIVSVQFDVFKAFEKGRFEKKCRTTHNIVDPPKATKNDWSIDEKMCFVTFGSLTGVKRMDLMIRMFAKAHKENEKIELHIYGDGPQKAALEALIREEGLTDCVFLKGYCNDVHNTMLQYDAYLMTSYQEGFPNSLTEAMALGMPSVSFCCHDGILELTENGEAGFVAAEGDEDYFVRKMLLIASDETLRKQMGTRAKNVCVRYSKEHVMAQWQACIKEAMK